MGSHQQQPASTVGRYNAVGKSKILNRDENPSVTSHTSWRVTNLRPKVLEPSHPIKCGFLSPGSQTNFVSSAASSIRDVEEQALTSIAVNRVQSGGGKGQKRPYKTVSPDEDGGNIPRKRIAGKKSIVLEGDHKVHSQTQTPALVGQVEPWSQIKHGKRKYTSTSHNSDSDNDGNGIGNGDNHYSDDFFEETRTRFGSNVTWTQSIIQKAEDILWHDLMWVNERKERFVIDLTTIQDDMSITKRGTSWVTNEANGLADKNEWMLNKMFRASEDKQLRKKSEWQIVRVREYAQLRKRFLELLLALIYITPQPPGPREGITTIKFRNGLERRNIYVIEGQLAYVMGHHKFHPQSERAKVNTRYLPGRVGQLLAIYLAYVQQFSEDLDQATNRLPRSDHLWHGKNGPWTKEHLATILMQETAIRTG